MCASMSTARMQKNIVMPQPVSTLAIAKTYKPLEHGCLAWVQSNTNSENSFGRSNLWGPTMSILGLNPARATSGWDENRFGWWIQAKTYRVAKIKPTECLSALILEAPSLIHPWWTGSCA
jgi:hypothetical protein